MHIDTSLLQSKLTYLEGDTSALSDDIRSTAQEYKRQLTNRFYAIAGDQIDSRIKGEKFHVSKKLDGHLQIVFYNGSDIFMCGRNGTVRSGLACLDLLKNELVKHKVQSFIGAAELSVIMDRCRVYDVIAVLADELRLGELKLTFFEILELNGEQYKAIAYDDHYKKLLEFFPQNVVETKIVTSTAEIKELYGKWVVDEKNEGLVVRSSTGFITKVKPKYYFDVAIIGYAEGINEKRSKVKSFLFAFRKGEFYQVVGKVGNIPDSERDGWFKRLSTLNTKSDYIETDNEGIAFHFVKPEIVIEVSCNDLMTETVYGNPLMNPLVVYENDTYDLKRSIPGIKCINLVFERERTDKTNSDADIHVSQFEKIVDTSSKIITPDEFPKSTIVKREVYKKELKDKVMVQKFMAIKTNKETIDKKFPAFVFHYTDFSSGRADPLQKEVKISNSEKQIMEFFDTYLSENVKKGWEKV